MAYKCTPNSKLHSQFQNYTPNSKATLPIPKLHSQFQNYTPNCQNSLRIEKTHSEFQKLTPNSKNSLRNLKSNKVARDWIELSGNASWVVVLSPSCWDKAACFAQTVDINVKTLAGFARIVGTISLQIGEKVCRSHFFSSFVGLTREISKFWITPQILSFIIIYGVI